MHHNSTASLQHVWHYSLSDLKQNLSRYAELLDDMLEKTIKTASIVIAAGLVSMFILMVHTLNHAHDAYANGLSCLICNSFHDLIYKTMTGFM